jgi:uncharacterized membrane protein AbrB (regulator of aidB expression)
MAASCIKTIAASKSSDAAGVASVQFLMLVLLLLLLPLSCPTWGKESFSGDG